MEYSSNSPLIINVDSKDTKRSIIEKVKDAHVSRKAVLLLPGDESGINTAFFVVDVFRRNGHFTQSMTNSVSNIVSSPFNLCLYICYMSNNVLEKQITRDDTLESLQNEAVNVNGGGMKLIRACGTACGTAWTYSQWLIQTGIWHQMGEVTVNAIPVKIDSKIIFKTTIQINLQRFGVWAE
tara:strand:- start:102 stop:644 length:543 start_codon:yes stop_codon:yes gene_type:complete